MLSIHLSIYFILKNFFFQKTIVLLETKIKLHLCIVCGFFLIIIVLFLSSDDYSLEKHLNKCQQLKSHCFIVLLHIYQSPCVVVSSPHLGTLFISLFEVITLKGISSKCKCWGFKPSNSIIQVNQNKQYHPTNTCHLENKTHMGKPFKILFYFDDGPIKVAHCHL